MTALLRGDHNGHMKTAGVAELKARLSKYLAEVRGGEEVVITDRGRPVARLAPLKTAAMGFESLRDLEREGIVKLPEKPLDLGFLDQPPVRDPTGKVLQYLLEEREEGW